jgi:hypothetical protein
MSGGILSGLLGGMIGGDQAQMGTGILGNLNNYMTNNAGTLLGFGSGMLAGDNSAAAAGALQGMQADQRTRLLKQAEAEKERQKVAAQQLAQKMGRPELADFPDLAGSMYLAQNKPRDPQLVGSAETGYAWLTPGQDLPENLKTGTGPKTNLEIKTIKNQDGSESAVMFNPRTGQMAPIQGYGGTSPKAIEAARQAQQSADIVVQDIDRALEKTNNADVKILGFDTGINKVTGAAGQAMSNVGGTEARDVAGLVNTIKANATFDKLQQMRKSSPTGAALGAVSDTENKLLGAAIGDLEQSQSKEQFIFNLKRVKKIYNEIIHGPGTTDENGNVANGGGAKGAVQGATRSGVTWSAQ